MAAPTLKYALGNGASTTTSSSITGSDTSLPLTATTNFQAKSGAGMALINEGGSSEELAYSTGLSGSSLTIPVANRGLEGGSAQAQASGVSVKGILTAGMWNDLIDSLLNAFSQTDGTVDGTKVVKVSSNDALLPASTSNIQVSAADPKRAFYVPASAMYTRTTNGAATGSSETSTNKIMVKSFDFDQSTEEYAQFSIPSPKYWNASTVTATFYWTAASGTGDVIWGIQGLALANDDALDTAFGTAQTVTDTLITTNDVHLTSATSAVTIGNSPTAGDWVVFQIYRDADAGGDTLNADAKLLGARIEFTIGQYNDA